VTFPACYRREPINTTIYIVYIVFQFQHSTVGDYTAHPGSRRRAERRTENARHALTAPIPSKATVWRALSTCRLGLPPV